jgi:hypothetical protein
MLPSCFPPNFVLDQHNRCTHVVWSRAGDCSDAYPPTRRAIPQSQLCHRPCNKLIVATREKERPNTQPPSNSSLCCRQSASAGPPRVELSCTFSGPQKWLRTFEQCLPPCKPYVGELSVAKFAQGPERGVQVMNDPRCPTISSSFSLRSLVSHQRSPTRSAGAVCTLATLASVDQSL